MLLPSAQGRASPAFCTRVRGTMGERNSVLYSPPCSGPFQPCWKSWVCFVKQYPQRLLLGVMIQTVITGLALALQSWVSCHVPCLTGTLLWCDFTSKHRYRSENKYGNYDYNKLERIITVPITIITIVIVVCQSHLGNEFTIFEPAEN